VTQFMESADSKLGGEIVWEATRPIVWWSRSAKRLDLRSANCKSV